MKKGDLFNSIGVFREILGYDAHGNITSVTRKGKKSSSTYGTMDNLTLSYDGNRLAGVSEAAADYDFAGSFEYKKANGSQYMYDGNGSLLTDKSRGIAYVTYDAANNPLQIYFTNGNVTKYLYGASGQKHRVIHHTAVPNITRTLGVKPPELTSGQILYADTTDYLLGGSLVMRNGRVDKVLFEGGDAQATGVGIIADTFAFNYYNQDHLGNNREVVDSAGTVIQVTSYYPFGTPYADPAAVMDADYQPYKYNGKELDRMHGLDTYDYGARQYDPILGRWDRMDPLCEKYYSISPYAYCGNNPVNVIDPNGMLCSPIYNQDGEFLGTDDDGLTGNPIVMNDTFFKQGMSHSEALRNSMKFDEMSDEAFENMMIHYSNLPNRPDYDGYLTFDEANEWYVNGKGQPLFTDLSKIDLSGIRSLGEKYVGQVKTFNLLFVSNSINDGLVYGNITLKRYPNDYVRAYADTYDFDMKSWGNPLNWGRNVETIIGKKVAGEGIPYTINIYGSKQLKPLFPWTR